jgi:hypothetical protein
MAQAAVFGGAHRMFHKERRLERVEIFRGVVYHNSIYNVQAGSLVIDN